jgi:hypothetical protein
MSRKADGARRFWTYPPGTWDGDIVSVFPHGDEFGNSTIVLRLPGDRAFVAAYNWPLRRDLEPSEGRVEYAVAEEMFDEEPELIPYEDRLKPLAGRKYLVVRDVMYGPWRRV